MKIKLGSGLLPLNVLAVILVLVIYLLPDNALRIVLGLPFVLFFPGYVLMIALFPRNDAKFISQKAKPKLRTENPDSQPSTLSPIPSSGMSGIELVALSFGLSIAIVPLIGLIMNYTPWGIRLESMLYSLWGFIIVMSVIGLLRQHRLTPANRRDFSFRLGWPNMGTGKLDRALSIILIIAILGVLTSIVYVINKPKTGEKFTEFYLLGINGKAENYPTNFILNSDQESGVRSQQVVSVQYGADALPVAEGWGRMTLGIVNHEQQTTTYTVRTTVDGQAADMHYQDGMVSEIDSIKLDNEGKWEQEIGIVPQHTGENQKVELSLYKDTGTDAYLTLHLWINALQ